MIDDYIKKYIKAIAKIAGVKNLDFNKMKPKELKKAKELAGIINKIYQNGYEDGGNSI